MMSHSSTCSMVLAQADFFLAVCDCHEYRLTPGLLYAADLADDAAEAFRDGTCSKVALEQFAAYIRERFR